MSNACTNSGCDCTPNQSIKCTVNNCAHHCQNQDYCGLTSITVGTHVDLLEKTKRFRIRRIRPSC